MRRAAERCYDLRWSRRQLAIGLLLTVAAAAVGVAGVGAGIRPLPERIGVDERRVRVAAERIDPNSACEASLRRLPNIGRVRAAAVVRDRQGNGRFRRADDLRRVRGIGPRTVERVRGLLRFGRPATAPAGP